MTMTLLEPPTTTAPPRPALVAPLHLDMAPCSEDKKICAPEGPTNWLSRMILKSYLSSFNFCLSELGWTPKRILEVGSGDGSLLSYLAQTLMGAEVVGVDFDADTVAKAKEHNCCRIEFMALSESESLPFEDNSFDLVVSHGLLSHTRTPRHLIHEMARVSAEAVIVSAPTPIGYRWLKKLPGASEATLIGHPVFTPNSHPMPLTLMKAWLTRAGLNPETTATPIPYGMVLGRKPQIKR